MDRGTKRDVAKVIYMSSQEEKSYNNRDGGTFYQVNRRTHTSHSEPVRSIVEELDKPESKGKMYRI